MAKLSGARILIESLLREDADIIFGYPGEKYPLYDELYDARLNMC